MSPKASPAHGIQCPESADRTAPALGSFIEPPYLEQLEAAFRRRRHVMLSGPPGTGKTHSVQWMARQRGQPLFVVQGHCDLSIEDLRGCPALRNGDSTFIVGPVVQAVEQGGILLVDEYNLVRPGVTAWLNNVLNPGGLLSIPEEQRLVPIHPAFLACFCCNEGLAGTREQNAAFKDRCRVIVCDYWPPDKEVLLLKSLMPEIAEIDARRMIAVANGVRAARKAGTVDFDFSIRTLHDWGLDAYDRTADLLESFRDVVLPKVGDALQVAPQHEALVKIAELALSRRF